MIKQLSITGVHTEASENVRKYVTKKIAGLDKYIPRHARQSAHADVKLIESHASDKKQCTCEVIMQLPSQTLTAKEATTNMFAAVDIVEQKLKNQLRNYKDKHMHPKAGRRESQVRRLLTKIKSRAE
jgi:ribosomal subunit interface protein